MSSGTERKEAPGRAALREFAAALASPLTYDPKNNPYVLFGILWGLPVPLATMGIYLWASGEPFRISLAWEHPVHVFFLLHPLLFAVLFGIMGTLRHRKDSEIRRLIRKLDEHAQELADANVQLKQLDRLKAEFVANVTHELKTPLVSILGYTESILEGRFGPLTEKQRNGLAISLRNVERLQKLIGELLEFERLESGEYRLAAADFDLVPLVQSCLANFTPQLEAKRLAVRRDLPASLPVRADREKIGRVLLNLVSNAVKFSPPDGSLGVEVRVLQSGGVAQIRVWDRCPGIPAEARKHLFTRFWQADASLSRKHGGTGLGLAIVKGILDAHNSAVRVDSVEGQGTSVLFTLPLADAGTDPAASVEEALRPNPCGHTES